jgi:tRNA-splicing ligase RtcB
LNLAEQQAILDNQGIVHGIRSEKELDEAPGAYKDITTVMENQKDLVEVKFELTPQAVIKA